MSDPPHRNYQSQEFTFIYSSVHKPMNFSQNYDRAQLTFESLPLFHFFASISTKTRIPCLHIVTVVLLIDTKGMVLVCMMSTSLSTLRALVTFRLIKIITSSPYKQGSIHLAHNQWSYGQTGAMPGFSASNKPREHPS